MAEIMFQEKRVDTPNARQRKPAGILQDNRKSELTLQKQQLAPQQHSIKLPDKRQTFLPVPKFKTFARITADGVAQRAKIWEDFDSYRGANLASQNTIGAYSTKYEIPLMVTKVDEYSHDDRQIGKVDRGYALYQQRFAAAVTAAGAANWNAVAGILKSLVVNINEALDGVANVPTGYAANDDANWANVQTAVGAAHGAVNAGVAGVAPQSHSPDARAIRTINYSTAVGVFPPTLVRLLRDIHAAWKTGQVMDQRSQAERDASALTANNPGALRSWHMNTSATLPAAPGGVTPPNAVALENHYTATSGVMNALGVAPPPGPVGYAEYTGTGILNDAHNSKIILDYKRGDVYLTLTHYQHWSNIGAGFNTQGQVPSAAGAHSPWFKIDINA